MKHKYYDVIVAWANGETIQYKIGEQNTKWWDFENTNVPNFNNDDVTWRIKSTSISLRYRNALMKADSGWYYISTIASYPDAEITIEEQHKKVVSDDRFVCWMGDYKDFYIDNLC